MPKSMTQAMLKCNGVGCGALRPLLHTVQEAVHIVIYKSSPLLKR